jgi:arabinan endo-1,5-alpha-L-arabinosidase
MKMKQLLLFRKSLTLILFMMLVLIPGLAFCQQPVAPTTPAVPTTNIPIQDLHRRDVCIYPDPVTKTYIMIGSSGKSVLAYTSKDLLHWDGPKTLFKTPDNYWGDATINGIWAPELHAYNGKFYLFLTFSTNKPLGEQWLNWNPRVVRGSTILVSDSLFGQYKAFSNHSIPPANLMTLDGTLYVEGGQPYMVYAHEWVQISNGTIECVPLKSDLSEATGPPTLLFRGGEGGWAKITKKEGSFITDGPFLWKSKSGKLFMIWASFSETGYTEGIAISESGKLKGPWVHQAEPLYKADGGHAMLFKTFDGKIMMALHSPNSRVERPHLFEMEDTGNTLQIVKELKN